MPQTNNCSYAATAYFPGGTLDEMLASPVLEYFFGCVEPSKMQQKSLSVAATEGTLCSPVLNGVVLNAEAVLLYAWRFAPTCTSNALLVLFWLW
jgi:hypothetical protein